jgi:superkiller protein 3
VGDLDAAIATAQKQLARNPKSARAFAQLGAAYAGKGDLRQAEDALRQSIEIDPAPRFVPDHYRLGHVLRLQGRFDEARKVHGHILEIAPKEISAHYELGAVSQLMGDEAGARSHLRAVIELSEAHLANNANDAERQLEMASAWARLGNTARAVTIARQAESRTVHLPVERAGLQVLIGKTDDAIRTLEQAVQNGYRNVVWMRIHTDLHALAGDPRFEDLAARIVRH